MSKALEEKKCSVCEQKKRERLAAKITAANPITIGGEEWYFPDEKKESE